MKSPIYSLHNLGSAYEQFKEDGFDKQKFFDYFCDVEMYYYEKGIKDSGKFLEHAKKRGKYTYEIEGHEGFFSSDHYDPTFVENYKKIANECLGFKEGDTNGN